MFQMAEPVSTASFDGEDTRWPVDWRIEGDAYAPADWRLTAYGDVPVMPWASEVRVLLRTPLGAFEGEAMVVNAGFAEGGVRVETEMLGNGPLIFIGLVES